MPRNSSTAAVHLRALVVAQHRDAARREAACEILERAVRADRFVAIVRSRAVHEHDRAKRARPARQAERAG